jgi:hypothetical protein
LQEILPLNEKKPGALRRKSNPVRRVLLAVGNKLPRKKNECKSFKRIFLEFPANNAVFRKE